MRALTLGLTALSWSRSFRRGVSILLSLWAAARSGLCARLHARAPQLEPKHMAFRRLHSR